MVGRIGEHFLVAGHAGVEDQLAGAFADSAECQTRPECAVGQGQQSRSWARSVRLQFHAGDYTIKRIRIGKRPCASFARAASLTVPPPCATLRAVEHSTSYCWTNSAREHSAMSAQARRPQFMPGSPKGRHLSGNQIALGQHSGELLPSNLTEDTDGASRTFPSLGQAVISQVAGQRREPGHCPRHPSFLLWLKVDGSRLKVGKAVHLEP